MAEQRAATAVLIVVLLPALAGCTVPVNWFGRHPPASPTPRPTTWEGDTSAAAKAFEEGRLEEAERQLEVARERAASSKDNDLEVATSLVNLAVVRRAQGDAAGALDLQKEALGIRERRLGPNHPDVASSLNSVAALYAAQDDYRAAEPLLTRALAIREEALGADDRHTAQSLNNLGLLYAAEGRYADAEPLYQRAVTIFERQPDAALATALENYAALLEETGRADAAAAMETRARAVRATNPGK